MVLGDLIVIFSVSLVCLVSLFCCLGQWVSVWEECGSKNWLLLDLVALVYWPVVLLLRLI